MNPTARNALAPFAVAAAALILAGCAAPAPAPTQSATMREATTALHRELDAQLGDGASALDEGEYFALSDSIMRRALQSCDTGNLELVGVAVEDEPLRAAVAILCPEQNETPRQ